MTAARIAWKGKPRCWDDAHAWDVWRAESRGTYGPCADCTPGYREAMRAQARCERPEAIFVRTAEGDIAGLVAEDPRYARLLMGLSLGRGTIVLGRAIEPTETWRRLLAFVKRRAHREVARAITIWMRRNKGGVTA